MKKRVEQGDKTVNEKKENQSPKGNMWSAVPLALLGILVIVDDRQQGSHPKEDNVLQNTGGLHSFVHVDDLRLTCILVWRLGFKL